MNGLEKVQGGAERVMTALDTCTTTNGPLTPTTRSLIFAAIDTEPGSREAMQAWRNARFKVIHHDAEARTDRTLWAAVSAWCAAHGRAFPPDAVPLPHVIVAAIERATMFRPATEVAA